MKEGLQTLKILLDKQKDQIETCKVWWEFLKLNQRMD
jgi:hypothetical protein